jgi:hypothetical protein
LRFGRWFDSSPLHHPTVAKCDTVGYSLAVKYKLPRELEPIREWLTEQRPWKDRTLEENVVEEANLLVNPTRALITNEFQGGIFMLIRAIRDGKIKTIRHRRPKSPS